MCRFGWKEVSNPWKDDIDVIYWVEDMTNSRYLKGLVGTVSDARLKCGCWDWKIEIFLGTIWTRVKGNFKEFVKELFRVWLEEWLHMIFRWERFKLVDNSEEKPVRKWVELLTS